MTRINLLPPEKLREKRVTGGRSYVWLLIVIPLIVIVAMGFWYFTVSSKSGEKDKALKAAKAEFADWQAKNQELEKYRLRQEEIVRIEQTVVAALQDRVYWARILNDIAIMCPYDIWLTSLSGQATEGSGDVSFEGYALQCPNRIHTGWFSAGLPQHFPDYRPIAYWLERMAQIVEFQKVWLSSAEPTQLGTGGAAATTTTPGSTTGEITSTGTWVMRFSSQATLNKETATIGGSSTSAGAPATAPTNAPSTPSVKSGGETK